MNFTKRQTLLIRACKANHHTRLRTLAKRFFQMDKDASEDEFQHIIVAQLSDLILKLNLNVTDDFIRACARGDGKTPISVAYQVLTDEIRWEKNTTFPGLRWGLRWRDNG